MRTRDLVAGLTLTAVLAVPLAAQSGGTLELGIFGGATLLDRTWNKYNGLNQASGIVGGRLGLFVVRNLSIEADGGYSYFNGNLGNARQIPLHGRLVYNWPLGSNAALMIGAGYVHNEYGVDFDGSDDGGGGMIGIRFPTVGSASLRFDVTTDYIPSPANLTGENWHVGGHIGLSWLPGNAPRDSDKDGVADSGDNCPATPAGVAVDAVGCPLDGDNDRVPDFRDQCPDTPAGATVDANGCPVDTDKDGVPDFRDRCADTPAGTPVDANGCPRDSDGDGVIDPNDRCPNTPAGTRVDANGCPVPVDSDNDGVMDDKDRCPNTPAGTQVDAVGCRIIFQEKQTTVVLEGVTFATGKATLTEPAKAILLSVAQSLAANPDVRVEVAGHTDNTGSRALNMRLSQARAESVRDFLVQNGVQPSQLEARGYGPDKPVASNRTRDGRQQNRRVELNRLP